MEAARKINDFNESRAMTPDEFITLYAPACFYHFTDKRNIDSIKQYGLHPLATLQVCDIPIPAPGGNDWSHDEDRRRGLDSYVHLCFFDQHPMEYTARQAGHIGETVFLEIDPAVLRYPEIRFSSKVANKADAALLTLEEAVTEMDFQVIFERTDWKDPAIQLRRKAAKKYELLIPNGIPTSHIFNL